MAAIDKVYCKKEEYLDYLLWALEYDHNSSNYWERKVTLLDCLIKRDIRDKEFEARPNNDTLPAFRFTDELEHWLLYHYSYVIQPRKDTVKYRNVWKKVVREVLGNYWQGFKGKIRQKQLDTVLNYMLHKRMLEE